MFRHVVGRAVRQVKVACRHRHRTIGVDRRVARRALAIDQVACAVDVRNAVAIDDRCARRSRADEYVARSGSWSGSGCSTRQCKHSWSAAGSSVPSCRSGVRSDPPGSRAPWTGLSCNTCRSSQPARSEPRASNRRTRCRRLAHRRRAHDAIAHLGHRLAHVGEQRGIGVRERAARGRCAGVDRRTQAAAAMGARRRAVRIVTAVALERFARHELQPVGVATAEHARQAAAVRRRAR